MTQITYLEALLLRQIHFTCAEVFTDRDPCTIYVDNLPADEEELIPIINKFHHLRLLNLSENPIRKRYTVSDEGKLELQKFFIMP